MRAGFDPTGLPSAFGGRRVVHRPGLADEMLRELAPLLAEDGIDMNDPESYDIGTLNAALARATERKNLELFTPVGEARERAVVIVCLVAEALDEDRMELARIVIHEIEPVPQRRGHPSVANVIGVSLGLLDSWYGDRDFDRVRLPEWNKRALAAGTDILALARKSRAFDSIGALHLRHSGLSILEGGLLGVAGSLRSQAESEGRSVRELASELRGRSD